MSCLGELLWKTRRSLGLTIVEVARRAGYRNVNKGIRRYTDIETGSDVFPKEVIRRRFTEVLGLDEADILAAMLMDFEELDRPVAPRLIIRIMASAYAEHPLPRRLAEGATAARPRSRTDPKREGRARGLVRHFKARERGGRDDHSRRHPHPLPPGLLPPARLPLGQPMFPI